mmetsp:Transcript_22725/g.63198  ORF Transcript_22725/g.63198 Transcript_22725/m.63198 type:complete len:647 (+) Transcript_22725:120-2060(+)|eukprot:CAMPEP_0168759894 /NCGR_PEP_ID=MMETSP0724-20121128/22473_1 /TAXON_ID=265536 /ORGANISM="Amphiprora sp., Strain CCMP467" /LENGTH=646 /DNA_ID=CAMNT_0008808861 /DNA_START=70 /DNA_END=2010 /DNA_ORIENTATION=-
MTSLLSKLIFGRRSSDITYPNIDDSSSFLVASSSSNNNTSNNDNNDSNDNNDTDNNNDDDNNNDPLGTAVADTIRANLELIPDDSLLKLDRQLEFWRDRHVQELLIDRTELVDLTRRLIHAATWRSRTNETSSVFQVPKVRFGRTEVQMPIVTCGGMRIQQTWLPENIPLLSPSHNSVLAGDSQRNLKQVVQCCLNLGLNHFETARMYGTSELQFVDALCSLMDEGVIQREDFIFQTKVYPSKTLQEFETSFNATWEHVKKLGYVDLFAFHVVSKESDVDRVLSDEWGGYEFIRQQQAAGHIKHIGFSSHGTAETILRLIDSDQFDYVNLHAHYFGSYHGAGTPVPGSDDRHGNEACVERALELDMGVFQISPFDKGGKLYKPSTKVATAVGHHLTPISFAALHSWKTLGMHTVSVGLARPSDLDEVLEAASLYQDAKAEQYLQQAYTNLEQMAIQSLGEDWYKKGLLKLPSCYDKTTNGVAIGHILWLHNVCKAFGMYEFARDRYANLETAAWDDKKTFEENLDKWASGNSGRGYIAGLNLDEALKDHYNPELAKQKMAEAHEWLQKATEMTVEERKAMGFDEAYSLTVWEDYCGDQTTISAAKVVLQNLSGGWLGINNAKSRADSTKRAASLRGSIRNSLAKTS